MSLTVLQLQGTQLTRVPTVAIVQSLSHVWLFATPWTAAHQAAPSSLSPGLCSNSSPLSQWCYLTILSSATPFSLCLWSFTLSGSFPVSRLFPSGGWSIGVSASTSVLPKTPRTDLLWDVLVGSPCSSGYCQESSPTPQLKSISSSVLSLLYSPTPTSVYDYGKTISLTLQTFVGKVMFLLFKTLSRFAMAFLPRTIF